MVDVKLAKKFDRVVTLEELRAHAAGKLKNMIVLKRGNRLSITPVTKSEWEFVTSLASKR
jgi:predicted RNA-binding protein with PUA-like domain